MAQWYHKFVSANFQVCYDSTSSTMPLFNHSVPYKYSGTDITENQYLLRALNDPVTYGTKPFLRGWDGTNDYYPEGSWSTYPWATGWQYDVVTTSAQYNTSYLILNDSSYNFNLMYTFAGIMASPPPETGKYFSIISDKGNSTTTTGVRSFGFATNLGSTTYGPWLTNMDVFLEDFGFGIKWKDYPDVSGNTGADWTVTPGYDGATVNISALSGYVIEDVQVNYVSQGAVSSVTAYDGDYVYIKAKSNMRTLSLWCDPLEAGAQYGAGSYLPGTHVTFGTTPLASNWRFVKWNDGSTAQERYIIINEDLSYYAIYEDIQKHITLSSNLEFTTLEGEGLYNEGDSCTVKATPTQTGYEWVGWKDRATGTIVSTDNPYTFTVTTDITLDAWFQGEEYTITCTGEHCTFEIDDVARSTFTKRYPEYTKIKCVSDSGYVFSRWTDDSSQNPRNVRGTATYTAEVVPMYTLTVTTTAGGTTIPYGTSQHAYETNVPVVATANEGYEFVKWSDGVTTPSRVVFMDSDKSIQAIFREVQYVTYKILNNPLFYTDNYEALRPYANNIYNEINGISYIPHTVDLFEDYNLGILDSITVDGVGVIVMDINSNVMNGVQIASKGDSHISDEITLEQSNSALIGKYNVLNRTQEETTSQLGDATRAISTISQRCDSIELSVSGKVDGDEVISSINMSPEAIQINANKLDISGKVSFSDLSTAGETSINGANLQTGSITADKIDVTNLTCQKLVSHSTQVGDNYINVYTTYEGTPSFRNWQTSSVIALRNMDTVYGGSDLARMYLAPSQISFFKKDSGTEVNTIYVDGVGGDITTTGNINTYRIYFSPYPFSSTQTTVKVNTDNGLLGIQSSSRRYKQDIEDLEVVPDLYSVPVRRFRYKAEYNEEGKVSEERIGLIAEELNEVLPGAVSKNHEGQCESIDYEYLVPVLLKMVQDQNKRIEELEAKLS